MPEETRDPFLTQMAEDDRWRDEQFRKAIEFVQQINKTSLLASPLIITTRKFHSGLLNGLQLKMDGLAKEYIIEADMEKISIRENERDITLEVGKIQGVDRIVQMVRKLVSIMEQRRKLVNNIQIKLR